MKFEEYRCVCNRILFEFRNDMIFDDMLDKNKLGGSDFDFVYRCDKCKLYHHLIIKDLAL